jgi:NAD(P)-dependent dehydrogenase (short-subunit alcohol dehydrogenase family)
MARLADEAAFITGADTGIGRCTAEPFAREGARAAVVGIAAAAAETAHRIARAGGEVIALHTDVTEPDNVQAAINETRKPDFRRYQKEARP